MAVQRRLAAILAADVAGYSRLMGEDEMGTRARFNNQLEGAIRPAIDEGRGRLVKTMGDGFLVEFGSVVDAVQCAADIQSGVALTQSAEPDDRKMLFRIGVHLGDVIVENEDIHGDGVNIAARLEGLAEPGGICVSAMVYEGVRGKLELDFSDIGDQTLKNIAAPVHTYRVQISATGGSDESTISSNSLFRRPAVAVLPFENMSGDSEQEYFSDGLSEDLITALSQWRSFPVIARNSTFVYRGQSQDVRKVGKELGARYVIEGSVRNAGNRVRVTAQLINAENGHHVWSERYDREIDDFFDLQDEITQQIVAVIAPELDRAEQMRSIEKQPESLDAWECYQRGMSLWLIGKKSEVAKARVLFEQAMELDPTFARAYVEFVATYYMDVRLDFAKRDREKAVQAARRAIELDGNDALSHWALGLIYYVDPDPDAAITEFREAIQLNPSFAEAHSLLGMSLSGAGRAEEAIPCIEQAIRLNPRDPMIGPTYSRMARTHLFLKRHEEAVKWARQALRHQNTNWPLTSNLVSALAHLDRLDEAHRAIEEMEKFRPGITIGFIRAHSTVTDPGYVEHLLDGLRKAGLPE